MLPALAEDVLFDVRIGLSDFDSRNLNSPLLRTVCLTLISLCSLNKITERAEKEILIEQIRGVLVTPSIYSSQSDPRSRIMSKSRLAPICNVSHCLQATLDLLCAVVLI
jgi:hypothetical protein